MKQYWLVKTEPSTYSWNDLVKDKSTVWTGVRNYAARNNLRDMKRGDVVLVYHSVVGKEIVGLATVTKTALQDPTTKEVAWLAVELTALKPLTKPVSLDTIKTTPALKSMKLVKLGRLSVSPVTSDEFKTILKLGGLQRI